MTLFSPEEIADEADDDASVQRVTFTGTLTAVTMGRIGPLLDQFRALAEQAGVELALDVPGYEEIWYGWAKSEGEAR